MPYSRKRYGSRRTRKTAVRTPKGRTYGKARRGKYSKVSRKRSKWQSATTVSPYRKFVYNDQGFAFTLTSILFQYQHVFRGNSLFDPDSTGVGVQPYGYDSLCGASAFFNNYNVKSSKITIYPSVAPSYVTNFPPYFELLIVPYRSSTLPFNEPCDIRRMPYCRSIRFSSDSQANHTTKVSSYSSSKAVLGAPFATDVSSTGQYDGNPTYTWYWIVTFDTGNWAPTANIAFTFDVKIKYYTKLIRKQEFNES